MTTLDHAGPYRTSLEHTSPLQADPDMPPPKRAPLIACTDASEDISHLLANYLQLEGFRTVAYATPVRWGPAAIITFLTNLQPDVCVYTISLPYAESWAEFQTLKAAVPDVPFVLTTTNRVGLEAAVGPVVGIELLGKPFALDQVCQAVRHAAATSPPCEGSAPPR